MTPKEKAKDLYVKYAVMWHSSTKDVKKCMLIAVEEIINSNPRYPNNVDWDDAGGTHAYYYEAQFEEAEKYWEEVKEEIEKL